MEGSEWMSANKNTTRKSESATKVSRWLYHMTNNEMDWRIRSSDSFQYLNDIVDSYDTIRTQRKIVDKFIPYRHEVADKLNDPMNAFTKK